MEVGQHVDRTWDDFNTFLGDYTRLECIYDV